ncbi:neurogenic locus Notch protein-like, partial [Orbicella faveolata]|uniref:neurogenic locus Notch protein-like n=1 Tax=Orbicella faveolata TaxID=48498 RepID=UPI0009E3CEFF
MWKTKFLAVTLLLLALARNTESWRRRRRRRSPPPCPTRNCLVGSWSSWGACSRQCGTSGTQSRWRSKAVVETCGGTCHYPLNQNRACNRDACKNSGTPHSSGCSCRPGYRGTCCESDVNECQNNPCQHTCTNTFGSFTCSCYSCYTKVGYNCDLRQCKISNRCYSYGTVNPSNQCQDCNSTSKLAWRNNNALSCSDNKACTKNDRCSNGVCSGTPFTCLPCEECYNDACRVKPGYCVINDGGTRKCFNHGDIRPGYPCQQCDSNRNNQWSYNNNLQCSDNNLKTKNDRCSNVNECQNNPCQHTCTNTFGSFTCSCYSCYTKVGYNCDLRQCKISNRCYSYGTVNPSNQCQDCNSTSKLAWRNNNALSCSDNKACTKNDRCSNGVCSGTPFTCLPCEECYNDACRVKPGYCVINDGGTRKCFNHGDIRPGYPCQQCDSNRNNQWTNNNNLQCSDNNLKTKNDRCSSGTCVGTPYNCLSCETHDGSGCPIKSGYCIIQHGGQRTCYAKNHYKPGNPCQ